MHLHSYLFFTPKLSIFQIVREKQKYACNPETWVDQFSDEFFRFAIYRVKNREVAEDLVQDTFLSGLKYLDKFRRDCPQKSWLYNILRNKIIDHFRKKVNQEIKQSNSAVENDEDAFFHRYFKNDGHWQEETSPANWDISADKLMEREEFMHFLML